MRDLLKDLMDSARSRAEYADARWVRTRSERLATRNGALDSLDSDESEGIGVRVRVAGCWGFAAVRGTERRDAEAADETLWLSVDSFALTRALAVAAAQPLPSSAVELAPEPPAEGSWRSPAERDPFEVPLEEKLSVLLAADEALRKEPLVALAIAHYRAHAEERIFASTEGALCEQRLTEAGGGIAALAVESDHTQIRSSRSTSPWATPSSSTACSAARPPTRARASCRPTASARCASAPST